MTLRIIENKVMLKNYFLRLKITIVTATVAISIGTIYVSGMGSGGPQ